MRASGLIEILEGNIDTIFNEEKYKEYLRMTGKFHEYSWTNTLLILIQKPDAHRVAGIKKWNEFGRYVIDGEKGIGILAPKIGNIYRDTTDGHILKWNELSKKEFKKAIEEGRIEVTKGKKGYIKVTVFDISQTYGKDVPSLVQGLKGKYVYIKEICEAIRKVTGCKVHIKKEIGFLSTMGYYDKVNNEIVVRYKDDVQVLKTLIHEASHVIVDKMCSNDDKYRPTSIYNSSGDDGIIIINGRDHEIVAESVAYIICNELGVDTSEYSFSYILSWASIYGEEEGKVRIRALLDLINKVADKLLRAIKEELSKYNNTKDIIDNTKEYYINSLFISMKKKLNK